MSRHDSDIAITTLDSRGAETRGSYAGLLQEALRALHGLQARGVARGHELVIQLDSPRAFMRAFWASVLGGIIAIPLHPVGDREKARKLLAIWSRLDRPRLLTDEAGRRAMGALELGPDERTALAAIADQAITHEQLELAGSCPEGQIQDVAEHDVAFVQYSSGSTATPKGVVLSHQNLLANIDAIRQALGVVRERDRTLSWMPLTHDMGIIGFHLAPLAAGIPQYVMPAGTFVRRPTAWLHALTRERATITGAPDFAYRYVLERARVDDLPGPGQPDGIDLSHVRIIVNGAEQISPAVCRAFTERMARFGLRETAMSPAYGLAEACLMVTAHPLEAPLETAAVSRRHLHVGSPIALPGSADDELHLTVLGAPVAHVALRIVDDDQRPLADGEVGHVQIRGPSVTSGYHRDRERTAAAFTADGWLQTGDVGFLRDGRLALCGRFKDIICANGQNLHAHDLERALARELDMKEEALAVCGAPAAPASAGAGAEEVIAFVRSRGAPGDFVPTVRAVQRIVPRLFGCAVARVLPVPVIPMTTSGKKQRYRLRQQYLDGEHDQAWQGIAAHLAEHGPKLGTDAWQSELEVRVAALCQRALRLDELDRTDDLFSLGLDSLGGTRLLADLEAAFGVELPLDTLRVCSTVATIAARIAAVRARPAEAAAAPDRGGAPYDPAAFARDLAPLVARAYDAFGTRHLGTPVVDRFPVGPLQRRHLRRLLVHPQVFDIDIHVTGGRAALQAALADFVGQQELLRATVHARDGGHDFQIHAPAANLEVPVIDVSGYDRAGREQATRDLVTALAAELEARAAAAPLLYHLTIIERTATDYTVVFLISHLISDHESGRILEHALTEHLCGVRSSQGRLGYRHFLEHIAEPNTARVSEFAASSLCQAVRAARADFVREHRPERHLLPWSPPLAITFDDRSFRDPDAPASERPANKALHVFLAIARELFPCARLPVKIALNRRVFGELSYRNTIGEFHDNVILAVAADHLTPESCHREVGEALRFMDEHSYLLASMKDDPRLRDVAGATPLSYNYLGAVAAAEDERILRTLRPFPLTFFPCLAYAVGDRVRVLLNNGLSGEQLARIQSVLVASGCRAAAVRPSDNLPTEPKRG